MIHQSSGLRSRLDVHLEGACRWLERAGASPSGQARSGWSWTRGWRPPSTQATAWVAVTLARAARSEACPVDTQVALRCGAALLERQQPDGSFAPMGVDEEEEPAISASVEAACALHELTGDTRWRDAARRGATRLLAARLRPTSALALSAAWACAPEERLWHAAHEGVMAALHRTDSRAKAPLAYLPEAVEDLEVVLKGARHLGENLDQEPAVAGAMSALVLRLEASAGMPSRGYGAAGELTRSGLDFEMIARAAELVYTIQEERSDPRACFAGDLAIVALCDRTAVGSWFEGRRGALGVGAVSHGMTFDTAVVHRTASCAATGRLAAALARARRSRARAASHGHGTKPQRRAWWMSHAVVTPSPRREESGS